MSRTTVAAYGAAMVRRNQAISITGSEAVPGDAMAAPPASEVTAEHGGGGPAPPSQAISIPGSAGRKSHCIDCIGFETRIVDKLGLGLSAQRIYQDLRNEADYRGSYSSIRRFVQKTEARSPLPFRRIERPPGEEAQVDFGQGALTPRPGKQTRRRPSLLRVVLSFSRKGYTEVVWHQSTDDQIRCLENAFASFGGVPRTLVIDNLC